MTQVTGLPDGWFSLGVVIKDYSVQNTRTDPTDWRGDYRAFDHGR